MKRYLPLLVLGIGILILFGGFCYDAIFAGIPYQDPTPEMSARYSYRSHIASNFYRVGGGVLLIGAVACITQLIIRRLSQRHTS